MLTNCNTLLCRNEFTKKRPLPFSYTATIRISTENWFRTLIITSKCNVVKHTENFSGDFSFAI